MIVRARLWDSSGQALEKDAGLGEVEADGAVTVCFPSALITLRVVENGEWFFSAVSPISGRALNVTGHFSDLQSLRTPHGHDQVGAELDAR